MKSASEICDRLDGIRCGTAVLTKGQSKTISDVWLLLCQPNDKNLNDQVILAPRDFLAFCRAVVRRIDGPVFTPDEIVKWLDYCEKINVTDMSPHKIRQLISDQQHGIAAVTENKKGGE